MSPARFTRAQLQEFRGARVDDLIEPGVRLLFVGINPGLWTAAANAHFARPGNRFWPALHRAGITRERMDVSEGMSDADRAELVAAGVGITNLVPYATARADELTAEQIRAAAAALTATVERFAPRVVAVLGLTAYRQAFGRPRPLRAGSPTTSPARNSGCCPTPAGSTRTRPPPPGGRVPRARTRRRHPTGPLTPPPLLRSTVR